MRKKVTLEQLVNVMARLRSKNGCPWDLEQTHESLLKYLKEESQEFCSAVEKKDVSNMKEELGDVFLQILFHAQIASEKKQFDIYDVLRVLKEKLVRRHPHVFDKKAKREKLSPAEVVRRWKIIKKQEKMKGAKKK